MEGSPVVSVVALYNVRQHRDGSRNSLCCDKSENTNHCQSAVVDLDLESSGLGFLALVLGESKRIEEVKRDRVGNTVLQWGESTNLVGLVDVGVPLEESNKSNDLGLGREGEGVPLGRRGEIRGRHHVSLGGECPGEDKVALDNVSNKGGHGNTSVLDLSLSEESDGIRLVHTVKTGGSKVQRIPEVDKGVELLGQSFEVGLCCDFDSIGVWNNEKERIKPLLVWN